MENEPRWKMTAKLPLLVLGIAAVLAGWFLSLRGTMKAVVGGAALMIAGLSMIVWSSSIHNWCVPEDMKWGNVPWERMRFHDGPASLRDCLALVGLTNPPRSMTLEEIRQKVRDQSEK